MNRLVAAILIFLFVVLHQDTWLWRVAHPLVFGFMPIGLFYHVVFTGACAILMWLLATYSWPDHLEPPADRRAPKHQ